MAEQSYDGYGYDSGYAGTGGLASFMQWTGAVVSLVLVAGLCLWGYRIAVRDVSDVPVIRAIEGPFRVQPDDPGGATAAYQGLAVNSVQADGGVERPADRVVLAPDPVQLTDEDLSGARLKSEREIALNGTPKNLTDVIASDDTAVLDESEIDDAVTAAIEEAQRAAELAKISDLPGVKRSPRPKPRVLMAARETPLSDATPPTAALSGPVDVDPSEIDPGTRLVQLGAFDDRASAEREWAHILDRHGDLIGDKKRLIQEAASGGRSFYRLRLVGFADLNDSRRLCSALLARGTPCIPVTAR
jgi:hypothetical protein